MKPTITLALTLLALSCQPTERPKPPPQWNEVHQITDAGTPKDVWAPEPLDPTPTKTKKTSADSVIKDEIKRTAARKATEYTIDTTLRMLLND